MANIYRNQKLSLTSTADTVLYTVPSNSRAIVKSILIAEDNNASATAEVTLLNSSSTVFVVDNLITLAANENKQVISEPLIMEESEVLKVQAASGAVDVVASVLEINREDK